VEASQYFMEQSIKQLNEILPNWVFSPYSTNRQDDRILCIPNGYINHKHHSDLRAIAPIAGNVGAVGYLIHRSEIKIEPVR